MLRLIKNQESKESILQKIRQAKEKAKEKEFIFQHRQASIKGRSKQQRRKEKKKRKQNLNKDEEIKKKMNQLNDKIIIRCQNMNLKTIKQMKNLENKQGIKNQSNLMKIKIKKINIDKEQRHQKRMTLMDESVEKHFQFQRNRKLMALISEVLASIGQKYLGNKNILQVSVKRNQQISAMTIYAQQVYQSAVEQESKVQSKSVQQILTMSGHFTQKQGAIINMQTQIISFSREFSVYISNISNYFLKQCNNIERAIDIGKLLIQNERSLAIILNIVEIRKKHEQLIADLLKIQSKSLEIVGELELKSKALEKIIKDMHSLVREKMQIMKNRANEILQKQKRLRIETY